MPSAKVRDSVSPSWSCCYFDFEPPSSEEEHRRASRRIGVEREMRIMYQQPHLVPPMKLTVYDDLPPTPAPLPRSSMSGWMSKASSRASLSIRRRASKRPSISAPVALTEEVPLRRRRSFRPLELSIYLPNNRLSDLPEFDRASFSSEGEIKLPPRALVRTRSEQVIPRTPQTPSPRKPASMFQEPTFQHHRQDTSSTVISTSRPPSEYDALHSHPVAWNALPGLPAQCHHRHVTQSVSILSPMQEEFTPVCTPACITIGGTVLEFPKPPQTPVTDAHSFTTAQEQVNSEMPTVFKLSSPPLASSVRSLPLRANIEYSPRPSISTSTSSSSNFKRVSQWLGHSHSTSSLTSSTTRSFAEHRRKRSEFYQCRPPVAQPQAQIKHSPRVPTQSCPVHGHERKRTLSASTVDTNIMSLDDTNSTYSATNTLTTVQGRSRSATVKSFSKPIIGVQELSIKGVKPDLPPTYADVTEIYVPEIDGSLRSPEVGLAF